MKRVSTLFLRAAILAVAVIVLAICIFALPAMWRAVPGDYPNIRYVFYVIILALYAAAIPFYFALYQAVRLLSYMDKGTAFSGLSVRSLKHIELSALVISLIFLITLPFVYIWAETDDAPGLVVIGMFLVAAPFTIGIFADVLQRLFREAIDYKAENELTV
jgi:hypothetical protein